MVFLKINRLYLTNKKIYTNKFNNKLKNNNISNKNITKYLIIYKNHKKKIILYEKLKKNFFTNKKNNVFITQFKYINNQHYINIIITKF